MCTRRGAVAMKPIDRFRWGLGLACLGLQLAGIVASRVSPGYLFAWAPYHDVRHVCLRVVVGGRSLTPEDIKRRYRIPLPVRQSVVDTRAGIRQYEMTYGKGDGARVTLGSLSNGYRLEIWTWPPRT